MNLLIKWSIIISTLSSSYALADNINEKLSFHLEAQKINFSESVTFCKKSYPKIGDIYKKYLGDFVTGTRLGLKEVSKEINLESMSMSKKDQDEMLAMQGKQGGFLLKQIRANPAKGCPYIMKTFQSTSQKSSKDNIMSMFNNYKKDIKKYCSQTPKPKNCS